jgi:hypothetical protein
MAGIRKCFFVPAFLEKEKLLIKTRRGGVRGGRAPIQYGAASWLLSDTNVFSVKKTGE